MTRSSALLGFTLATLTALSGCGTCTAVCSNSVVLTAIDAAGTELALNTVIENAALSPTTGCGVTAVTDLVTGVITVTSFCTRFGVDAVATNGKRFSGILDVSSGVRGPSVCGSMCRSANIIITLD